MGTNRLRVGEWLHSFAEHGSHSAGPPFQEKMAAIVRLYVDAPSGEPVLSAEEKTGLQALSQSRRLQPAHAARAGRLEFDYRRHGTRCLFACFNVRTDNVLGRLTEWGTRKDFFSFLDEVATRYRQRRVRVCGDDLILGRHEPLSPGGELEPTVRVKLTHLGADIYGLSALFATPAGGKGRRFRARSERCSKRSEVSCNISSLPRLVQYPILCHAHRSDRIREWRFHGVHRVG